MHNNVHIALHRTIEAKIVAVYLYRHFSENQLSVNTCLFFGAFIVSIYDNVAEWYITH